MKKILIIDDEPITLINLTKILEKEYQVETINPTSEMGPILDKIKFIKPDLIILDILMPNINGFEVCAELKDDLLTKTIPIIFLSSKEDISEAVDRIKRVLS